MKELEKTKRISIASVLFILIILIALLTYKRPKHLYTVNPTAAVENIATADYLIGATELNELSYQLVDIRSQFEFDKGHLENAINMYAPEILSDRNTEILNQLKIENKVIILYGANPNEALIPYLNLYQLGVENMKILLANNSYKQNKLISQNITIEESKADITGFINESVKKAAQKPKPVIKKVVVKKVVPVKKKKKKMPMEGGC